MGIRLADNQQTTGSPSRSASPVSRFLLPAVAGFGGPSLASSSRGRHPLEKTRLLTFVEVYFNPRVGDGAPGESSLVLGVPSSLIAHVQL